MNNLITGEQLGIKIKEHWLFRHFSFHLEKGETLAVEGASGSGKSTFLKAIVGLRKFDEGEITILDCDFKEWNKPDLRRQVFYLHQDPPLYSGTVLDQFQMPFGFRGYLKRSFDYARAVSLLSSFGKEEPFLKNHVKNLSGGEKQIVSLIRAILMEPRVILLDEPSSSIDEFMEKALETLIIDWIKGSSEQRPRGLIITSHNTQQIKRLADRKIQIGEKL
jgi:putative ABC transport system ATP-binding protein